MSSHKRAAESPEPLGPLEEEQRRLNDSIRVAKKRVKGHGSFNARFWANSRELETLSLQMAETNRKISLQDFKGRSGGVSGPWPGMPSCFRVLASARLRGATSPRRRRLSF